MLKSLHPAISHSLPRLKFPRPKPFLSALLFVFLFAIGVLLASCSTRLAIARVPQLVLPLQSDPATFNYPLNTSVEAVFAYLYEGLLTTNGETGELQPALAESWQIAADKKRIVFTLRPNLKWSDGKPLTVDDVVFTYQAVYLNEAIPTSVRDILQIGTTGKFPSVRKLDDRRIEFSVPEPFAPFLRYSGGLPILPAHALQEAVQTKDSKGTLKFLSIWGTNANPQDIISNGMYQLQSYTPGERVILTRNPYYWRKDAQGNILPYLDRLVLQIFRSEDAQLLSFRSAELDSFKINPEAFQLVKSEEERGNFTIYNAGPESGTRSVSFNLITARDAKGKPLVDPIKSRWFNTLAFRQAVAHAIDRERMKNTIYQGLGELQNSPLDSQNPFYVPPEAGVKAYEYDPDRSRQLLQSAGFKYDATRALFDAAGNRVQFVLLVRSEEKSRVSVATQIQQDLTKIGIKVDLQILSFNTVLQKLKARTWECYVGGFRGGGLEPHSSFNVWSSTGNLHQINLAPQPGETIEGWQAKDWELEIDRLFDQGVKELDESKRKVIYKRFQQLVQEQVPFIYLVNPLSLSAVRDRFENLKFTPIGGAFWNLYEIKATPN